MMNGMTWPLGQGCWWKAIQKRRWLLQDLSRRKEDRWRMKNES